MERFYIWEGLRGAEKFPARPPTLLLSYDH